MSRPSPPPRSVAVVTLFVARAVYAFNWYDIGAVLPLVGRSLGAGLAELGVVLAAFLLGAGLFQLPAGFAAMRWGNRAVSIGALAAMAAFTLASAASPNWMVLAATRFGAGAGAAFFFAPALGLATSYFPPGSRGPVIGVYNAGFSLGSGISLIVGAIVGLEFGWPWALAVGGLLLVGGAVLAALLLPADPGARPHGTALTVWRASAPVLKSRPLWALAVGTSGLWATFYVAAQYFLTYARMSHGAWAYSLAALIPTVMIFAEIPGGPIGGWFGERRGELRRTLALWGSIAGVGVALVPLYSFATAWVAFAFLGFADGVVFALLYLVPTYFADLQPTELSLALALLNAIQIFIGSGIAVLFALVASHSGYVAAWALAGILALVPLPLLLWVPSTRGSRSQRRATEVAPTPRATPVGGLGPARAPERGDRSSPGGPLGSAP